VGGELVNPERNTPRVINTSVILVILMSVLANIAYFAVVPFQDIVKTNTIGLVCHI
jgi:amino acid transporter